jgi:hypothetical protein
MTVGAPKYAINYWLKSGVLAHLNVSVNPYIEEDITGLRPQTNQGILIVDMIPGSSFSGWIVHEEDVCRQIIADRTGLPLRDRDYDRCCQIDLTTNRVVQVISSAPENHEPQHKAMPGHDFVLATHAHHGDRWDGKTFHRRWVRAHGFSGQVREEMELPVGTEPDARDGHFHFWSYEYRVGDVVPLPKSFRAQFRA